MPLIILNITNCIVIGDARRLKAGKQPVRNIRGLSRELECINEKKYDADRICHFLYRTRSNKPGMIEIDETLLKDLQSILMVKEEELVRYQGY
ncbi:hypothetical protein [Christiangramia sp.]|uniref:hypothetical protein n=1 Tax=Christiangramia sp. TaxID=1931228 RepID=UPI002602386D|nr:hypothetical protein [Christiangramia sp.]